MKPTDITINGDATRTGKASTTINGNAKGEAKTTTMTETKRLKEITGATTNATANGGNPRQIGPGKKPAALRLGRREKTRLVGLYPDSGNGGQWTAKCRDGFLRPDKQKHILKIRLGATDTEEAIRQAAMHLGELDEHWHRVSAAGANAPVSASVLSSSAMQDVGTNPPAVANYQREAWAFLRLAGPLANVPPAQWTLDQFSWVRDARLAALNQSSAAPNQAMRNLRFLLREVDGLPTGQLTCSVRRGGSASRA